MASSVLNAGRGQQVVPVGWLLGVSTDLPRRFRLPLCHIGKVHCNVPTVLANHDNVSGLTSQRVRWSGAGLHMHRRRNILRRGGIVACLWCAVGLPRRHLSAPASCSGMGRRQCAFHPASGGWWVRRPHNGGFGRECSASLFSSALYGHGIGASGSLSVPTASGSIGLRKASSAHSQVHNVMNLRPWLSTLRRRVVGQQK